MRRNQTEDRSPQGTNVMLKAGTLLLAYALLVCPMYVSQAAPSRYARCILPV